MRRVQGMQLVHRLTMIVTNSCGRQSVLAREWFRRLQSRAKHLVSLRTPMTYGILFEKVENGELPPGSYYAHVPALV